MAITQNTYTGNGSTVLYSFAFPYLDTTDVKVSLNGTVTTAYTFANATTIQFNTAPGAGVAIRIYRETNTDNLESTFFAGSAIRAQNLNDNFTQILYSTQETIDRRLDSTGGTMSGNLAMGGNKITGLGTTSSPSDAATKTYVDDNAVIYSGSPGFTQDGTGAVTRSWSSKLKETVSVKDFGAVGDGVADDTAALQNALNSNKLVYVPPGLYRTTSTLIVDPSINRNSGFIGLASASTYPYLQQTGGPIWNGQQEAVIQYDGTVSTTTAVISASDSAIGVEPAATFNATLWAFTLKDITLDANNKAGYGLYTARVQNLQLDGARARGSTVAGMSINGTYSGSIRSVRCYLNNNRGFELGSADSRFGWTAQDKVNALYIYDLHTFSNGSSATFRESDPNLRKEGCGIYFGPHRSAHIYGVVSENNFGANIVYEPTSTGNSITGFYTELGCKYMPGGAGTDAISLGYATKQWGVIFVGVSGGSSLNNRLVDGICATDAIWLTGTEPTSSRRESAFEIYNCSLATSGLTAEWSNYRLVNCALELESITGSSPTGAFTVRGGLQFAANTSQLTTYEEGTFTPSFVGATNAGTGWGYSLQSGAYTRIGRTVFVSGRVALSSVSVDATGVICISGLPFTVKNANNFNAPASLARTINFTTSIVSLEGAARPNFNQIQLTKRTAASASSSSVVLADLSATTSIDFACCYVVA
jgi:hypothetical protein